MTQTKQPETLAAAMAAAFGAIEAATKGANNPHFKTKYADLTSVIEAIKPPLVANGLFFTQHPTPNEKGVEIETILHHKGGESMSLGVLFVPADRGNAQGFGSALTYARRYALVTAFGVPVEDDDGNAAAASPPKQQTRPNAVRNPAKGITTNDTLATITEAQLEELQLLFTHLRVPVKAFLDVAKVADLSQLPAAWFDRAKEWVNDQAKAKREAPSMGEQIDDEIAF
jgi:hypothetical protein